jgi:hyperosmotically inducible protein
MKRYGWLIAATTVFALAPACQNADDGAPGTMSRQKDSPPAADNTNLNERDKSGTSATPLDQGNGAADLETTQRIRRVLMADDSLSSDAKNAKVITNGGVVTLRGPVKNESERQSVAEKARTAAGSNRVDDLLDVKSTP